MSSANNKDYVFPDESDDLSTYVGGTARLKITSGLLQRISEEILCSLYKSLLYYSNMCWDIVLYQQMRIATMEQSSIKLVFLKMYKTSLYVNTIGLHSHLSI